MTFRQPLKITVEKTKTGFSAFAHDYPIYTTGKSVPELINHANEAVALYWEESKKPSREVQFEIDFQQFFRYYRVLNAKFLAERIGMNPTLLSQYVQGIKKPSAKQTQRILDGIHQIGKELVGLQLLR